MSRGLGDVYKRQVEELMDKIGEYTFVERSNEVRTDREKLMGQHVDYKL